MWLRQVRRPSFIVPAIMGPPETKMVGMFTRAAAMSRPGTFLSQAATITRPSNGCAVAIASTLSAMSSRETSEYFMPLWPIARPSQTAMAGKTMGTPPPRATPCFTASVILSRKTCPGTMSFCEETTPMSGRSISASQRPRALRSARWGAALMPFLRGSERM